MIKEEFNKEVQRLVDLYWDGAITKEELSAALYKLCYDQLD